MAMKVEFGSSVSSNVFASNLMLHLIFVWTITIVIGFVGVLYLRMWHAYWSFYRQGIPCPKPVPLFGSLWNSWKKPLSELDLEDVKKYGPIHGTFDGLRASVVIADLAFLQGIYIREFGHFVNRRDVQYSFKGNCARQWMSVAMDDEWKEIRNLCTPAFTSRNLKNLLEVIVECAEGLAKNMEKQQREKQYVQLNDVYGAYVLNVIASCVFGASLDSFDDKGNLFVTQALKLTDNSECETLSSILPHLLPNFLQWFQISKTTTLDKLLVFFKNFSEKVVESRIGEFSDKSDFLDIMLDQTLKKQTSFNQEDNGTQHEPVDPAVKDIIIAQCVLFLTAGFDTTRSLLSWTSYHLATHPEIQRKLYEEINRKINTENGLTYEHLSQCPYLDMVINETLRLTPPFTRTERTCTRSMDFRGIRIPKGMVVKIPIYAIHHSESNFPESFRFIPERFCPGEKIKRHPYAFMPFGHGPRSCLGTRFAMEKAKIALIHIIKRYEFKVSPETKIPPELLCGSFLLQAKSMKLEIHKRPLQRRPTRSTSEEVHY